jgi:hypothetical protein
MCVRFVIWNGLRSRDVVNADCEQCDALRAAGLTVLGNVLNGVDRKSCATLGCRKTSREPLRPSLDAIAYTLLWKYMAGDERCECDITDGDKVAVTRDDTFRVEVKCIDNIRVKQAQLRRSSRRPFLMNLECLINVVI